MMSADAVAWLEEQFLSDSDGVRDRELSAGRVFRKLFQLIEPDVGLSPARWPVPLFDHDLDRADR